LLTVYLGVDSLSPDEADIPMFKTLAECMGLELLFYLPSELEKIDVLENAFLFISIGVIFCESFESLPSILKGSPNYCF
jgi:hypothetical protein